VEDVWWKLDNKLRKWGSAGYWADNVYRAKVRALDLARTVRVPGMK